MSMPLCVTSCHLDPAHSGGPAGTADHDGLVGDCWRQLTGGLLATVVAGASGQSMQGFAVAACVPASPPQAAAAAVPLAQQVLLSTRKHSRVVKNKSAMLLSLNRDDDVYTAALPCSRAACRQHPATWGREAHKSAAWKGMQDATVLLRPLRAPKAQRPHCQLLLWAPWHDCPHAACVVCQHMPQGTHRGQADRAPVQESKVLCAHGVQLVSHLLLQLQALRSHLPVKQEPQHVCQHA